MSEHDNVEDMKRAEATSSNAVEEKRAQSKSEGITRRTFAIGLGSTIALLGLGSTRFIGLTPSVRPPGGQDEPALISKCVHCYRCVEACPYQLIVPSSIERGIIGMRTPRMEFSRNEPGVIDALRYCDFCARANGGAPLCVEVCPTEALHSDGNFDFDTDAIGTAKIDTNLCLAYRGARCAFCYDACRSARGEEASAIYYENLGESSDGALLLPLVDEDKCNGCGACESICVSAQAGSTRNASMRAIVIEPIR